MSENHPTKPRSRLRGGVARIARGFAIILGAGDYDAHLRHAAAHGCTPLSRQAFQARRFERRYARSAHRCC
ncbi:CstA-like transporter-associated (seleno)protein [Sphingomonas hengshuiensis]|uniref:DUF466 domain-containing protein n=1 Tax=Sphingomonas hengshuiensis TaxID=1609977 RepID=A0A7U4LFD2_9SPHN|nr:CstA-like transporter-associated (seleno)protein [Sphingomonas hengshuiensis]AJP72414.1 hypothetical protein TS85_12395 [Sphingomonas hengshuiensis]